MCDGCEYLMEDETCGAFECRGLECPDLPCEKWWVFTFGSGQKHAGYYVRIQGTFEAARKKMIEKYGKQWAFQYSQDEWSGLENDPDRPYPLEKLLETIE